MITKDLNDLFTILSSNSQTKHYEVSSQQTADSLITTNVEYCTYDFQRTVNWSHVSEIHMDVREAGFMDCKVYLNITNNNNN